MIKIGCCINVFSIDNKMLDIEYINSIAKYGYDYIELPLVQIMQLSDSDFQNLSDVLTNSKIHCEVCNVFFPAQIRLTGEQVYPETIEDYVQNALGKAKKLGVSIVVFGSSGSKNVPEGFSHDKAFEQIVAALKIVDKYALLNDIFIAIEPLNHMESNIILNLTDATRLLESSDFQNIKLLVDYYHYIIENDSEKILEKSISNIVHVHFAKPDGRGFPVTQKPEYIDFFKLLKDNHYQGRISFEAVSNNLQDDLKKAILLFQ